MRVLRLSLLLTLVQSVALISSAAVPALSNSVVSGIFQSTQVAPINERDLPKALLTPRASTRTFTIPGTWITLSMTITEKKIDHEEVRHVLHLANQFVQHQLTRNTEGRYRADETMRIGGGKGVFFSLRPYYPKYLSFREALQIIEGFLLYIQEHGDDISYVTAYTVMTRDFELIATGLIGFLG